MLAFLREAEKAKGKNDKRILTGESKSCILIYEYDKSESNLLLTSV